MSIELYQHGIRPGGKVTFNNFRNFFKFGNYVFVHGASFQFYTNISTGIVTQCSRINMITGTDNYLHLNHFLHPLMDGSPRDITDFGYIFERDTGILRNNFQYFPV